MRGWSGRAGLVVSGGGSDQSSLCLPQAPNPKGTHQSHTGLEEGPDSPHSLATSECELMSSEKCGFCFNHLSGGQASWPGGQLHRSIVSLISKLGSKLLREFVPKPQMRARGPSTEGSALRSEAAAPRIRLVWCEAHSTEEWGSRGFPPEVRI